ncbi:DUF2147 domain-containing protein [Bradyrhizobium sp. KBS0727]|uniref:DUF2147 domain-containing protein n=1 Tax=unclassified Bradyrhizobium TaxID=2631580 RepID=UPI00110F2932|nr:MULTISPECIES: DUF2147 domain-containing protein [unclassified Bradyrhizobium]QDW38798.1 DUF2147 domain-containing protein [Bradyrhizobium sp. KBS0725]QDW45401.1 DUF2147 domain-containing protein [Bradyrhizobium sp. KBS0727]
MKKLLAIAALLLASTAAQAQYTFEYGGRTIRVDPDRGTVSIPGVYDNSGRKAKRSRNEDTDRSRKSPQQAKTDSQQSAPDAAAPAPSEQAAAPAATAPVPAAPAPVAPATASTTEPSTATAAATPADTVTTSPPAPPAPPVQQEAVPVAKPADAPAPLVAAVPPTAPAPAPAAVQAANSPLGLWLTEEKEGKVRIEQCGANLCGYSVDKKSNQNGEQVLINMKPAKDAKWSGRILDPNTGSTYDSTIALKGSDSLRVQGCAFGGVFCGGQTWTRVN